MSNLVVLATGEKKKWVSWKRKNFLWGKI